MQKKLPQKKNTAKQKIRSGPPAKVRIASALRKLLETRDFHSITTAEIARTAEANEALIYRYFGDKRGLLHNVLGTYLKEMLDKINSNLFNLKKPVDRLRRIIRDTIDIYNRQRVFAKIVLVEARNFPGYFDSDSYQLVRRYAHLYTDTINVGTKNGDFRNDIPPSYLRDAIIGMIEHQVMPHVIFGTPIDTENLTETVYTIVLQGIMYPSSLKT